jgi:HD-GYP domain-containing protein (c-di-GMP phosphodiesterase class II)
VSDIYDAMTTDRPYRPAIKVERVVSYLKDEAQLGHVDERVVHALIRVLPVWGRRLQTESALKGLSLPELRELEEVA